MLNRFPFLWFENFTYGRNWPILEPISTDFHQYWPKCLKKNGHFDTRFNRFYLCQFEKFTYAENNQFWNPFPLILTNFDWNACKKWPFDTRFNRFHFFWFANFTLCQIDQFWNPLPPILTNMDPKCFQKWSFWQCAQSIPFLLIRKFHPWSNWPILEPISTNFYQYWCELLEKNGHFDTVPNRFHFSRPENFTDSQNMEFRNPFPPCFSQVISIQLHRSSNQWIMKPVRRDRIQMLLSHDPTQKEQSLNHDAITKHYKDSHQISYLRSISKNPSDDWFHATNPR